MKISGWFSRQISGFIFGAAFVASVGYAIAQIVQQPTIGSVAACAYLTAAPMPTDGQAAMVWCPGGASAKVLSAATTNATVVKATPGVLFDVHVGNTNAATAYLKFYNKATAPTCNTDPVIATYVLVQNIPVTVSSNFGRLFTAGIGLCITAAQADNDNTAATTGITVTMTYK